MSGWKTIINENKYLKMMLHNYWVSLRYLNLKQKHRKENKSMTQALMNIFFDIFYWIPNYFYNPFTISE